MSSKPSVSVAVPEHGNGEDGSPPKEQAKIDEENIDVYDTDDSGCASNIQRLKEKRKMLEQEYSSAFSAGPENTDDGIAGNPTVDSGNSGDKRVGEETKPFDEETPKSVSFTTPGYSFSSTAFKAKNARDSGSVGAVGGQSSNFLSELDTNAQDLFNQNILVLVQDLQEELNQYQKKKKVVKHTGNILSEIEGLHYGLLMKGQDDEAIYFPRDSYSLIALNGPTGCCRWTKQNFKFFAFGMLAYLFQLLFFLSSVAEVILYPESGSPFAANMIVRATRVLALLAFAIYPNSTVQDLVKSVRLYPRSSVIDSPGCLRLTSFLRLVQGILAVYTTWALIMDAPTVVQVILRFSVVNFVSGINRVAFSLARYGMFGPDLQDEAMRIETIKLPGYMHLRSKQLWYRILRIIFVLFFLGTTIYNIVQRFGNLEMGTVRLQFQSPTGLDKYSGCFERNQIFNVFERDTYTSYDRGTLNTSIGYCENDRQWIMFKGDESNVHPCDAMKLEIARSSKTDGVDIASSFSESWMSSSGEAFIPLFLGENGTEQDGLKSQFNLFGVEEKELHCDLGLGDGICDPAFNEIQYNYDGGDCCSATCIGPRCGSGALTSAFNTSDVYGDGFPDCKLSELVPLTIVLNDITSSRDPKFAEFEPIRNPGVNEITWRVATPVNPNLSLDCNGKHVFSVDIDQSMESKSETVMVEDGADCTMVIRNTVSPPNLDSPIWFVDYELFHGDEKFKILTQITQSSSEMEVVEFSLVPECFFSFSDSENMYTGSGPSINAIDWLLNDDSGNSQCEDELLIERFGLAMLDYTINGNATIINEQRQCTWPFVDCDQGAVTQVDLNKWNLGKGEFSGNIAKILDNFKSLKVLNLTDDEIVSVPPELVSLTSLMILSFASNELTSIPNEIMSLTNLDCIYFDNNSISSIPAEIESLTKLGIVELSSNEISSIPPEIEASTGLHTLHLSSNNFGTFPTELFSLTSLQNLYLDNNFISSIPPEIKVLTNLKVLHLDYNELTYIPTELALLTNLQDPIISGPNATVIIPDGTDSRP